MGIINPAKDSAKRQGISVTTNAQISIKSGEALVLSTQPQTHRQSEQHNYQHHTPTLTQTSLGGQHLAERLTQLATGLGRNVNDHSVIKTQLENISDKQQAETHQTTPYTLIDSAADSSYVSEELIIQRTMGEILTTTQQDMIISSGDSHSQVSSESLNIIADGQFSMTNAKDNIMLSAHTGKLAATAKQDVNIASSTKEVEIVATNKITLTAGGASITLDGANITIVAKQFTEKGGKHSKAGGGMDGLGLVGLPSKMLKLTESMLSLIYGEGFQLLEQETQQPIANQTVWIKRVNGDIEMIQTDEKGQTPQITEDKEENIELLTPPQLGIFIG